MVTDHFEPHEDVESFQANGTFSGNTRGEQLASIGAVFGLRDDGVMIVESLVPGGAAEKSGSVEIGNTTFQSFSTHTHLWLVK